MQKARDPRAEETVEVAPDHEDGTGLRRVAPSRPMDAMSSREDAVTGSGRDAGRDGGGVTRIPGEEEHGRLARREVLRRDRERAERDAKIRRVSIRRLRPTDRSTG
jgi:hypothetical protein